MEKIKPHIGNIGNSRQLITAMLHDLKLRRHNHNKLFESIFSLPQLGTCEHS